MRNKTIKITKSDLFDTAKENLFLALPIIGSRIIGSLVFFTSMWFIARLGHQAVAAGALISVIISTITMIAWSPIFATSVFVGQAYGAKNYHRIGTITRVNFWLGLIVGVPFTVLLLYIKPILLFFGQPPHLVELADQYFRPFAFGMIPSLWCVSLFQLAIGISKPRLAMFWNILNFPIMLVPGYILTFGKFGLPKLGIAGMGYANAALYWIMCLMILTHLVIRNDHKKYGFFTQSKWIDFECFREILSFGAFITVQIAAEMLTFTATTLMVGRFGESALAARQITIQVCSLLLMIPYGLSQANMVLISQANGSISDPQAKVFAIRKLAYSALFLGGVAGLIMGLFFCLAPKLIISFYLDMSVSKNLPTVELATIFLLIASMAQFFDILRVIAVGILRGIFDSKTPMFVSVFISCFMSLPIGYLLAFMLHMGPAGVMWGFVFTCFLGAVILIRRVHVLTERQLLITNN